jgi:hypothetical protein
MKFRNEITPNVCDVKIDEWYVFFGDRKVIKAVFIACFDVRNLPLPIPILIGLKLLITPIGRFPITNDERTNEQRIRTPSDRSKQERTQRKKCTAAPAFESPTHTSSTQSIRTSHPNPTASVDADPSTV